MKFDDKEKREKWLRFIQILNPDVDPHATRLMDEMKIVCRALHLIGERSLHAADRSYAQYRLLMGLLYSEEIEDRRDGLNPSEISERQGTSRNTISALIRSLEEEGLVERELDPDDRRKFNIRLTENGRSLVTDHARKHLRTIANCFAPLSPKDKETLSRLLTAVGEQAGHMLEKDEG